ncbi:hypothetical protein MVEN_00150600 [Mycena venus]|uniref:Uncharacterized protein n=1 Tax=Mycena venus TaxID=2733690 RepID=A0A8H6YZQ6_9AGAR|nr:hypothetical protein MVEN_00150600 [Mycena venus]
MFSRFFLVSLLFSAALIASAASTPFTKNLAIRQIQTDPACTNVCAQFQDATITTCNNTVVKDAATCFTCNVQHGSVTQDQAQQTLNTFVQACDDNGQPVNNVTISATSGSVPSGGSGSTSTPASSPTHTSEAEDPSTTDADGDKPSQTDAAGDPASASANATDSASASGPSAGASSAERMNCRSATVITAVMMALSVAVGLA